MSAKKPSTDTTWHDPDDAPELDAEWFGEAHHYYGDKLVRRGRGRPPLENPKEAVKVRYDHDVLKAFRDSGTGWQTRMNQALRQFLREHDVSELDQQ